MNCNDCKISHDIAQLWDYNGQTLCTRCLKTHLQKNGVIKLASEPEEPAETINKQYTVKEDSSLL